MVWQVNVFMCVCMCEQIRLSINVEVHKQKTPKSYSHIRTATGIIYPFL